MEFSTSWNLAPHGFPEAGVCVCAFGCVCVFHKIHDVLLSEYLLFPYPQGVGGPDKRIYILECVVD